MNKTNEGGFCICVYCDAKIPHQKSQPCRETLCPKCGKRMLREGSYHHQLYLQKKENKS
jgi:predicted amidophosphoribosyltransferase